MKEGGNQNVSIFLKAILADGGWSRTSMALTLWIHCSTHLNAKKRRFPNLKLPGNAKLARTKQGFATTNWLISVPENTHVLRKPGIIIEANSARKLKRAPGKVFMSCRWLLAVWWVLYLSFLRFRCRPSCRQQSGRSWCAGLFCFFGFFSAGV